MFFAHLCPLFQVMCFNLDLIKTFGTDVGTEKEKWTDEEETKRIKADINQQIEKDNRKFIYSHQASSRKASVNTRVQDAPTPG